MLKQDTDVLAVSVQFFSGNMPVKANLIITNSVSCCI